MMTPKHPGPTSHSNDFAGLVGTTLSPVIIPAVIQLAGVLLPAAAAAHFQTDTAGDAENTDEFRQHFESLKTLKVLGSAKKN